MTKMNQKEREMFYEIIGADLNAIQLRVVNQIEELWDISRKEIIQVRGLDAIKEEKEMIKITMDKLKQRLSDLEKQLSPEKLTIHQEIELGAKLNKYDTYSGANFFGIPVRNEMDYAIVQRIKETVDTDAPAKYLSDLAASALREITMAGTFEEAKKIYEDFYALDFRKYGVDIPPRLKEMREAKNISQKFMLNYAKGETDRKKLPPIKKPEEKKKKDSPEIA